MTHIIICPALLLTSCVYTGYKYQRDRNNDIFTKCMHLSLQLQMNYQ